MFGSMPIDKSPQNTSKSVISTIWNIAKPDAPTAFRI